MKALCTSDGNDDKCIQCGLHIPPGMRQQCPAWMELQPKKSKREGIGLGDYTELMLKSIGVTPGRYKEVKEKFGYAPTCNCEELKQYLNKVGRRYGIGR